MVSDPTPRLRRSPRSLSGRWPWSRPRSDSDARPLGELGPGSGSGRRHVPGTPAPCAGLDKLPPANAQQSGGRAPAWRGPGGRESGALRSPPGKAVGRTPKMMAPRWEVIRRPRARVPSSVQHFPLLVQRESKQVRGFQEVGCPGEL